jgi:hypothetical protein
MGGYLIVEVGFSYLTNAREKGEGQRAKGKGQRAKEEGRGEKNR